MAPFGIAPDASLAADILRAEELLSDLASELQRVPLSHAVRLHVRALEMKRDVDHWEYEAPGEPLRRAALDELLTLQEGAQTLRRHAEWSQRLAG